jgi:pyruvate decarboxylase
LCFNIYVGLPTDIALQMTPAANLKFPLIATLPPNDPSLQALVIDKIRGVMDAAKSPIIIVDGGMSRSLENLTA